MWEVKKEVGEGVELVVGNGGKIDPSAFRRPEVLDGMLQSARIVGRVVQKVFFWLIQADLAEEIFFDSGSIKLPFPPATYGTSAHPTKAKVKANSPTRAKVKATKTKAKTKAKAPPLPHPDPPPVYAPPGRGKGHK